METSAISGTLLKVYIPGAIKVTAINFKMEFLAPEIETSPTRQAPPTI